MKSHAAPISAILIALLLVSAYTPAVGFDFITADRAAFEILWQGLADNSDSIKEAIVSVSPSDQKATPDEIVKNFRICEYLHQLPRPASTQLQRIIVPGLNEATTIDLLIGPDAGTGEKGFNPNDTDKLFIRDNAYKLSFLWHKAMLGWPVRGPKALFNDSRLLDDLEHQCGKTAVEAARALIRPDTAGTGADIWPSPFLEKTHIEIVLQCSSSMRTGTWKTVPILLKQIVSAIPPGISVALRMIGAVTKVDTVNGEQTPNYYALGGSDLQKATALVIPFQDHNVKNKILDFVANIQPLGPAPIALAVSKAIKDDQADLPAPAAILLISTGRDTGGGDLFRYLIEQRRKGDLPPVSALSLDKEPNTPMSGGKELLRTVLLTSGKYYDVSTVSELVSDLKHMAPRK